jgi:hypothetical protein
MYKILVKSSIFAINDIQISGLTTCHYYFVIEPDDSSITKNIKLDTIDKFYVLSKD